MSTDVNTKEFWEQVKKEYQPTQHEYAFCGTSDTFCVMWNDAELPWECRPDKVVIRFADEFLERTDGTIYTATHYLFNSCAMGIEDHIQIRRDFLNYMINKFS